MGLVKNIKRKLERVEDRLKIQRKRRDQKLELKADLIVQRERVQADRQKAIKALDQERKHERRPRIIASLQDRIADLHERAEDLAAKTDAAGKRAKTIQRAIDDNRREAGQLRKRLKRAREHRGTTLQSVQIKSRAPGDPHWGGAGDVMEQFIEPFMVKRGLPIGSGKRTPAQNAAVGGSPISDHLTTHTTTAARDFPTYEGEDDARALAEDLGCKTWTANSYASFNFTADGHNFRAQILWGAAIGHADHVHVGVSAL